MSRNTQQRNGRPQSRYIPQRTPSPFRRKRFFIPSGLRRFMLSTKQSHKERLFHWFKILWLTGVDYFSTLGYQPGIALAEAGAYSPFATVILVFVTLFGAVPTYREVAKRSYMGQGSIAMLENMLHGWRGKLIILTLLGFATTDFVVTITLSAADAAAHVVENPLFSSALGAFGQSHIGVTTLFLLALAGVFLMGFNEAIGTAILVAMPYILLNFFVLGKCLFVISARPELVDAWLQSKELFAKGHFDWTGILIASALVFPKLALGLSGFETGVSMMPLISNGDDSTHPDKPTPHDAAHHVQQPAQIPLRRIASTRILLTTAALLMSLLLLTSSLATTILMKQELVQKGNVAYGRAISYLAHLHFGETFGTIYDISTVTILWFAGASALAGLLNLIPRYLPRFGMAPRWAEQRRPLVLLILLVSLIVTIVFHADVEAQAGAYATGVLVLILSAASAVSLAFLHEFRRDKRRTTLIKSLYFWCVTAGFTYTLLENVRERPDGLIISLCFISAILLLSAVSRWFRAFEIRVDGHKFVDRESEAIFQSIVGKKINLIPISTPDVYWQQHREAMIRHYYKLKGPLAFLSIKMQDDRSEFRGPLTIAAYPTEQGNGNIVIEVTGATALPNTIAYISEQIDPIALFLGLARKNAMEQAFSYLLFGEGEIGIITYKVLVQHWESTEEDDVRPSIFLMSE
jgi:hypothetical protein